MLGSSEATCCGALTGVSPPSRRGSGQLGLPCETAGGPTAACACGVGAGDTGGANDAVGAVAGCAAGTPPAFWIWAYMRRMYSGVFVPWTSLAAIASERGRPVNHFDAASLRLP